ncbi:MAG TPA: trypsin-like peptidase domain-containing protein [Actinocatenispora sp.]
METHPQYPVNPYPVIWQPQPPRPPRRWRRRAAGGAAALALVVGGGVAGAATVHELSAHQPTSSPVAATTAADSSSLADVVAKVQPAIVDVTVKGASGEGEGSGVVIRSDGMILTNNHVVTGAGQDATLTVTFSDGTSRSATVVGTDPSTDLAVVQVSGASGLTVATFGDSGTLRTGDSVVALGSPLGLTGTVTEGIVSALHRQLTVDSTRYTNMIQTDAALNEGNSGGALITTGGQLVGINTAIATSGSDSTGSIGVGFAIPSDTARSVANQLIAGH